LVGVARCFRQIAENIPDAFMSEGRRWAEMAATTQIVRGLALVAICAVSLAGCGTGMVTATRRGAREVGQGVSGARKGDPGRARQSVVRLIGDGSTAYTGPQPRQPRLERLKPGERPPQFVVFSWDGAGEDGQHLFSHFREVARKNNASMTFFLSGLYLLPEEKRDLYHPPHHEPGSSEIGFNDAKGIAGTLEQLRLAWQQGDEIGTHFIGHFCGKGGVRAWSVEDWKSEIAQAKTFVRTWKSNVSDQILKKAPPLPFDYDRELIGARTPCLEGRKKFRAAARELGLRYDSSGVADQVWPRKRQHVWGLSMQLLPARGRRYQLLSMDYNFMVNQSGEEQGDPLMRAFWGHEMRDTLLAGFERAYEGNRAPLIVGNHFESWNGGVYMDAVQDVVETVCGKPEVRCVSFRQLVDWLDVQDPRLLRKLRSLDVGQAPAHGWKSFLARPTAPRVSAVSHMSPVVRAGGPA
jgi:hypothetical protein